jgi:metallo-beta-lactamase class B
VTLRAFGVLGAVAISAAVFASAAPAQPPAPAAPDAPFPPLKIGEGLYYVGASDYASYLERDRFSMERIRS